MVQDSSKSKGHDPDFKFRRSLWWFVPLVVAYTAIFLLNALHVSTADGLTADVAGGLALSWFLGIVVGPTLFMLAAIGWLLAGIGVLVLMVKYIKPREYRYKQQRRLQRVR